MTLVQYWTSLKWETLRQASIQLHTIDPMGSTCKVLGFVFTHLGKNSSAGLDLTWLTNFCGVCGLNCWEDPQISANKQHKVTNLTIIVLLIMPVTFFQQHFKKFHGQESAQQIALQVGWYEKHSKHFCTSLFPKGQLISKCPLGVIVSTKKPTKSF